MEAIGWHPLVCPNHHRPDLAVARAESGDSPRDGPSGSLAGVGIRCLGGARCISRTS